jgi:hypothetical protein
MTGNPVDFSEPTSHHRDGMIVPEKFQIHD